MGTPIGRRGRMFALALLLAALAAFLVACGGRSSSAASRAASDVVAQPGRPAAASPVTDASAAATTQAAAAAAMQGAAGAAVQGAPPTTPNQASTLPDTLPGQLLIRTGAMELEASDPLAAAATVRQIAAAAIADGDIGYVADEREQSSGNLLTAVIAIHVPSATYNAVMTQLRQVGSKVLSETSSSQDVSEQYVDVEARLRALRATQAQLLQLLGKTQQLADTLAVQRQLTDINTQIEQLEGRENYLKNHSAYSTITVTIHQPATAGQAPLNWSPLATLLGALGALATAGQRALDVLIWVIVFGVPLAVLAGLAVALQRLLSRFSRQRTA